MYRQVIDILADENLNPRELLITIAKNSPDIVVATWKGRYPVQMEATVVKVYNDTKYSNVPGEFQKSPKIEAIKYLRNLDDLSLREAKKMVEDILLRNHISD
jgi:ribosomal protein L7/L12